MESTNHDDCMNVVGHYHNAINQHIGMVCRCDRNFVLCNRARTRQDDPGIDHRSESAFFPFGANGHEIPTRSAVIPIGQTGSFNSISFLEESHDSTSY